jgi:hypothetical protein
MTCYAKNWIRSLVPIPGIKNISLSHLAMRKISQLWRQIYTPFHERINLSLSQINTRVTAGPNTCGGREDKEVLPATKNIRR